MTLKLAADYYWNDLSWNELENCHLEPKVISKVKYRQSKVICTYTRVKKYAKMCFRENQQLYQYALCSVWWYHNYDFAYKLFMIYDYAWQYGSVCNDITILCTNFAWHMTMHGSKGHDLWGVILKLTSRGHWWFLHDR